MRILRCTRSQHFMEWWFRFNNYNQIKMYTWKSLFLALSLSRDLWVSQCWGLLTTSLDFWFSAFDGFGDGNNYFSLWLVVLKTCIGQLVLGEKCSIRWVKCTVQHKQHFFCSFLGVLNCENLNDIGIIRIKG